MCVIFGKENLVCRRQDDLYVLGKETVGNGLRHFGTVYFAGSRKSRLRKILPALRHHRLVTTMYLS